MISKVQRSWYMDKDKHFFEIQHTSKQILYCKNESAAVKWITQILQAQKFYNIYEQKIKSVPSPPQLNINTDFVRMKSNALDKFQEEEGTSDTKGSEKPAERQLEILDKLGKNDIPLESPTTNSLSIL